MNEKLLSVPVGEHPFPDENSSASAHSNADFDLHGFVGIRCIDATPKDVAIVVRQLGPIGMPLDREPDIVIRFVDRIHSSSPMRFLDLNDAAFTDDAFFILKGKHKSRTKVQIPFDTIGKRCEIICERGLAAVPELIAIVNQTALAKGLLPLHASAFNYEGVGVLATGWAKGGKTETLLAFMANGADYVGDEWVYLDAGGKRMLGIPEPIRIWDWHLDHLPNYRAKLSTKKRLVLGLLNVLAKGMSWLAGSATGQASALKKFLIRALPLIRKQLYVNWAPEEIFGKSSVTLAGIPDRIIFVASHESDEITVEPIDSAEVARRMIFSLQDERDDLVAYYRKFRFAFPDRPNDLIDGADEVQREMLDRAFEGKKAYVVHHPYPVEIPLLFEAIRKLL